MAEGQPARPSVPVSVSASIRAAGVIAVAWLAHAALRRAAAGVARGDDVGAILLSTVLLIGACIALSLALRVYHARAFPVPLVVPVVFLAVFAAAYAQQLRHAGVPGVPLPSIGMAPAGGTVTEGHPGRPRVVYHFNQHGLRGPDWEIERSRTRLCIVGDSYVFGSGVEWENTLGEELGRRLPNIEILNLGVPGHNLSSHITMYGFAAGRLQCDRIVMALVVPNDLSRWDINSEILLKSTLSAYSLVEFIFGPQIPARVWNTTELSHSTGAAEIAVLREQWERLADKRGYLGNTPLLVFTYGGGDVLKDLPAFAGVQIVPDTPYDPSYYIANDGHPNAIGNAFFAAHIADAIGDPDLQ